MRHSKNTDNQGASKTEILGYLNSPKELFDILYGIWAEEQDREKKELPQLLFDINKNDKVDFCALGHQAIKDGASCFDVFHVMEKSIPNFHLDLASTLLFLEKINDEMQNDLANGLQYGPFSELTQTQPIFSRELLSALILQDKPYIAGYISTIYLGFSKDNEKEIHKELVAICNHPSEYVVKGAVRALGRLNYQSVNSLVQDTIKVFEKLEERASKEINFSLVFSYEDLLRDSPDLLAKSLSRFLNKNDTGIDYALSHILFTNVDKNGNEDWFKEILMNLTKTSCEHKGIIDHLDYILYGLIKKHDNWNLAESFFIEWAVQSDYYSDDDKLSDLYNSTFSVLVQNRIKVSELVLNFFNHDDFRIHAAASELINYNNLHKFHLIKFNKAILSPLSYEDILYIGRKVLGYVIDSKSQCALIFSLLDKAPSNKQIQGLVYSIFSSHIAPDYSHSVLEFLEHEIENTRSKIKKDVAGEIIKIIKDERILFDSLPRLKELIPSRQQTYKVSLEDRKVIQKAVAAAQEKSIFAQIFTKIPLKYGRGSFSLFDDKYSPVTLLSSFETSVELPTSEITHPVYAAIDRAGFRRATRGAK